jgi:hypothetical protein
MVTAVRTWDLMYTQTFPGQEKSDSLQLMGKHCYISGRLSAIRRKDLVTDRMLLRRVPKNKEEEYKE